MLPQQLVAAGMVIALVGVAGCAERRAEQEPSRDVVFMRQAAEDNMAEIELGRIAAERAQRPLVREFGRRMVDEHTISYDRLTQIARSKNLVLPNDPPERAQRLAERLRSLAGPEFDRVYLEHMVDEHQKDIDLFQQQVNSGQDPDVVTYAAQGLPALQEHLRIARELAGRVGAEER